MLIMDIVKKRLLKSKLNKSVIFSMLISIKEVNGFVIIVFKIKMSTKKLAKRFKLGAKAYIIHCKEFYNL